MSDVPAGVKFSKEIVLSDGSRHVVTDETFREAFRRGKGHNTLPADASVRDVNSYITVDLEQRNVAPEVVEEVNRDRRASRHSRRANLEQDFHDDGPGFNVGNPWESSTAFAGPRAEAHGQPRPVSPAISEAGSDTSTIRAASPTQDTQGPTAHGSGPGEGRIDNIPVGLSYFNSRVNSYGRLPG